jgi:hypothetical protein
MDVERKNDIVCYYEKELSFERSALMVGKEFDEWKGCLEFTYDKTEGNIPTDYLANDMGWFIVSGKLKGILESLNTEIQFFPIVVSAKQGGAKMDYYIANITKLVDALCLEKSDYFVTEIEELGTIYTVSKYAIYESKVQQADIFKLSNRQEIPIFVSEHFKEKIEENNITGIQLNEIGVC